MTSKKIQMQDTFIIVQAWGVVWGEGDYSPSIHFTREEARRVAKASTVPEAKIKKVYLAWEGKKY